MNRIARRERLQAVMADRDLAGFIVSAPSNVRYLTGYTGSNGLVCLGTAARFMTDFRYATSVAALAVDWEVEIVQQSLLGDVAKRIPELFGAERIGFEASALSYSAWRPWTRPRAPRAPSSCRATGSWRICGPSRTPTRSR